MPRNGSGSDDNRADQLNPNNDAYWQSRGYDERPDDWEEKSKSDDQDEWWLFDDDDDD